MDLYLIDINKFYENNKPKMSKVQHKVGRSVLNYLLKNNYDIEPNIIEVNGKPFVEDNPIYFNISHSNKLVGIVFDNSLVGLDIEFKKKRNYKSVLKHFGINEDVSEDKFFQMWTVYEAEYKSGIKKLLKSFEYENYMMTISYEKENDLNLFNIEIVNDDIENPEIHISNIEKESIKFLDNLSVKI